MQKPILLGKTVFTILWVAGMLLMTGGLIYCFTRIPPNAAAQAVTTQSASQPVSQPATQSSTRPATQSASQPATQPTGFSTELYAGVLNRYVNAQGQVDYKGLKANHRPLDRFVQAMAALDPQVYAGWNDLEKIAFWINAYNALTLKAIIDNYPIKSSLTKSLRFPKNSIRQIDGVWEELTHTVMGRSVTLNQIEHEILRKEFNEPRIHMGLVCASIGCPFLRAEPYVGARLGEQLDEQTRIFLADTTKYRVDAAQRTVRVSKIFKWFEEDFVRREQAAGSDQPGGKQAVFAFIDRYVKGANRPSPQYDIDYLDYDWSLNEQ